VAFGIEYLFRQKMAVSLAKSLHNLTSKVAQKRPGTPVLHFNPGFAQNPNMQTLLFFDTETTGLVLRQLAADDARQPDVVQLAALLTDETGERVLASMNVLVRPNRAIDPGAAKAHGITQQDAEKYGVTPADAFGLFAGLVAKADVLVAHNLSFDALVMRAAWHRTFGVDLRDQLQGKKAFCTMKAMTPVTKILGPRAKHRADFKWPKLQECIEFFFSEKLIGAHDAMVDVKACARVYFELMRRRASQEALQAGVSGALVSD
jgi:DNA polymerase-3 subunit epsilon